MMLCETRPAVAGRHLPNRRGVTLLELIIVVAALALISGVTALVMPKRIVPPDNTRNRLANARIKALRTGRPVSVVLQLDTVYSVATALPDGSVLADSMARFDRLSGKPNASIGTLAPGTSK